MSLLNVKNALQRTAQMRATRSPAPINAAHQRIIDAVNAGDWGCQDAAVRGLVSVLTGVDIPPKQTAPARFVVGAAIVYAGETLLIRGLDIDDDALILASNGRTVTRNNDNYVSKHRDWREATDQEIREFFR